MNCNRHVCLKDLENYLKVDEYLSKYTPLEQQQIRDNIGAVGKSDLDSLIYENKCIYLLYSEFLDLINNNKLGVGHTYAIIDFQTIYQSNVLNSEGVYQSWGLEVNPSNIYTILMVAVTPGDVLDEVIIKCGDSTKLNARYDYTQEILPDGIATMGKITYLRDNNNNTAYFDFKNYRFRRTQSELQELGLDIEGEYLDLYTFNTKNFEEASNLSTVYNNHFKSGAEDNVFIADSCYNNIFEENFSNNTFTASCYNNIFRVNTSNNKFKFEVTNLIGGFNNISFIDIDYTSTPENKYISKTNEGYSLSYLDSDTLTLQVYKI